METYISDKNFERLETLQSGEYENCTFKDCNFAESSFSKYKFVQCSFLGCNLSLAKINGAVFQDVLFKDCKMLGLRFDTCHTFGLSFSFEGCQLQHSSFFRLKIKKTVFRNCNLEETDFAETDLTQARGENCSLTNAIFDQTILEKADLRTSRGYSIDPDKNRIKKARFSIDGIIGLLDKYDIEIEL